jgi:cytoskeletal protein RodZ
MFDRTDESPQIPNPPKNKEKNSPKNPDKNNKKYLFIGAGIGVVVLIMVLFLVVFNSPNSVEDTTIETTIDSDNTGLTAQNNNSFIDIKGQYTGAGKVLTINITSLTTTDSSNYSFEYTITTTQKPLDVGKGTYIPASNFIDFNKEIIGKGLVSKQDNTIFIKNDFWTVKKKN